MYDETKLPFGKPACSKRRCLAWHTQCTITDSDGHVTDRDVTRPPRVMAGYTAGTVWNIVAQPGDVMGLAPMDDALMDAKYQTTMTTSDSHEVNKAVSKHLVDVLPPTHFHIRSLCAQHRAGATCEDVGNKFGLLPGSMCVANLFEQDDFKRDLETAVTQVLFKYLHCVLSVDDLLQQTWGPQELERLRNFAEELLRVCHVSGLSRNDHEEVEETVVVGEAKRRREADEFITFFPHRGKV